MIKPIAVVLVVAGLASGGGAGGYFALNGANSSTDSTGVPPSTSEQTPEPATPNDSVPSIDSTDITNNSSSDDYNSGLDDYDYGSDDAIGSGIDQGLSGDGATSGGASSGSDYAEGCNPAPYATFDDFRCGSTTDSGFDSDYGY